MPVFALGVYVTEHVDELDVAAESAHVVELKLPEAAGRALNVTVPVGAEGVPPACVSVTVAVQTESWLSATGFGVQLTDVDVVRMADTTVIDGCVPVLITVATFKLPPLVAVFAAAVGHSNVPGLHEAVALNWTVTN